MQTIATNVIGIIVVLGFLVFAHESGHFFVAKLFRVRVLVFSLGFGKRLFGFRKGATDYRVSLVPLGGYVRMAGDTPEENQPANPDEFLSKPKWQRFLILLAGPLMNLIIALTFMAGLLMMGTETWSIRPVVGSVVAGGPAAKAGLQAGDRIVSLGGEKVVDFDDMRMTISLHAGTPLRVDYLRNGVQRSTTLTPGRQNTDLGPIGYAGIYSYNPTIIGRVKPGSPAEAAGLRAGDRIVAANGRPVDEYTAFDQVIRASKGRAVTLDMERGATRFRATLAPKKLDERDPYRGLIPPYD